MRNAPWEYDVGLGPLTIREAEELLMIGDFAEDFDDEGLEEGLDLDWGDD